MAEALYRGTGRRKTAVARVRLLPGDGKITVNGRELAEFFPRPAYQMAVKSPLELLGSASRYDVVAKIEGGGLTGQAEALHASRHSRTTAQLTTRGNFLREKFGHRSPDANDFGIKKAHS